LPENPPENRYLVVETGRETAAESLARIVDWLEEKGLISEKST